MGCVLTRPSSSSPADGVARVKARRNHATRHHADGHGRSNTEPLNGMRKRENQRLPERTELTTPFLNDKVTAKDGAGEKSTRVVTVARERGAAVLQIDSKPPLSATSGSTEDTEAEGWPKWLTDNISVEALEGLVPKSAEAYKMLAKVGQGTYSNVYKARERETGKIVALKKVRFDTSEPESIKFMAREISILRKLDHPHVVKLQGLATSRMYCSLYLVFDFMYSDLSTVISRNDGRLTEAQIKCYMKQLLLGLEHCHQRGILHRDLKGSNLLIDKNGVLKIGDFGLANIFDPYQKRPLTNKVVTLWYRAPELLLGTRDYGVGVDLWSAGCILAEMFVGRPIFPGRSEMDQILRIFRLCGSPSEDYWRKLKFQPNNRPQQSFKPTIFDVFRDFSASSLGLLLTLLALDPASRGTAASALQNEFFISSPLACDVSGLPIIYKEDTDPYGRKKHNKIPKKKKKSPTTKSDPVKLHLPMEIPTRDSKCSKEDKSSTTATAASQNQDSSGGTSVVTSEDTSPNPPTPKAAAQMQPVHSPANGHPSTMIDVQNRPQLLARENAGSNSDDSYNNLFGLARPASSFYELKRESYMSTRLQLPANAVDRESKLND